MKNPQFIAANDRVDRSVRGLLSRFHIERSVVRMFALVLIAFAFFSVLKPSVFLNPVNLQNLAIAAPEIGLIAVAMMLAMLTGGIDLSLVAIANLTTVTVATTYGALGASNPELAESLGIPVVLLGLLVGVCAGLLNGILIAVLGITPILATLGTMQIFNGIAVVWTGGKTLYGVPSFLTGMGSSTLVGIPVLFIIFVLICVAVGILLSQTPLGRKIELQGANSVAAKYSGINTTRILLLTYTITGALGGMAGVLFIARNPTASADYGLSYVLLAIVIAVLGGTNPFGGFATVTGVALAAVVLQIVSSGFTAIRLSAYEYSIAQGVILIAVMVFDQVRQRQRLRRDPSKNRRESAVPKVSMSADRVKGEGQL